MPFIPPMLCSRLERLERLTEHRYIAEPKLDGQRAPGGRSLGGLCNVTGRTGGRGTGVGGKRCGEGQSRRWWPLNGGVTFVAEYPCPRCGRDVPIYDDFRLVDIKRLGWSLFVPATYVNWCGHAQEFLPIPETDERTISYRSLGRHPDGPHPRSCLL